MAGYKCVTRRYDQYKEWIKYLCFSHMRSWVVSVGWPSNRRIQNIEVRHSKSGRIKVVYVEYDENARWMEA
jgi:hypothetical protein